MRCNYSGWVPLKIVLAELTNGDRLGMWVQKLAVSVYMRLKDKKH
jgi:hypothetical protein